MGKNVVVIGTQWGDEGKGKIVDWLTESATGRRALPRRPQRGPHARHRRRARRCCGSFPRACCGPNVGIFVGNGVVLSPGALLQEIGELEAAGVEVRSRLKISPACPLVLPIHVALDQARESAMGDEKIGTTGRGIGPAYEDKIARRALRVQDLLDPDRFSAKLAALLEFHNFMLVNYYKRDPVHFAKTRDEALAHALELRPMVADVAGLLHAGARARRVAAVRRRAGRAARHRPRHVSVRHEQQLPRGRRGVGLRHRAADARLRARHREGVHDARRHRPLPHRAHRRRRRRARQARQRVRLGHRTPAPLRLARPPRAQALAAVERRRRPVHHQARRARRHAGDPACARRTAWTASALDLIPTGAEAVAALHARVRNAARLERVDRRRQVVRRAAGERARVPASGSRR